VFAGGCDLDAFAAVALLDLFLAPARASLPRQAWDAEMAAGRALSQQQAAGLLAQEASAG
jgi:hypothetical protein